MKAYREIKNCRICGNDQFVSVLDLGSQVLSGIFPESISQSIPIAPLEMVKSISDYDFIFFVNPPNLDQIFDVAEAGETMPQKSTYFYPKVYSGLVTAGIRD